MFKNHQALFPFLFSIIFIALTNCQMHSQNNHKMVHFTSNDGTRIVCHRSGTGQPLVLVHGTSATHERWKTILPELEKYFTVYAMDRRGRGDSGDTGNYSIQREFEDVAAVINAIDKPVILLGHSFGALCSLEASLLTTNVSKLILYEPPIPTDNNKIYPEGVIEKLQTLLDKGDREGVVRAFFQEIVQMPDHEFNLFRASPAFPSRIASAHTLPRELREHEQYKFDKARFRKMKIPTLLLFGSESPEFLKNSIKTVANALPNHQLVVLERQQHIAMDTAPQLFLDKVLTFFKQ